MKKRFQALVNDKYNFDLTSEDALPFQKSDDQHLHATEGNHSVNAEIFGANFHERNYTLRINGGFYKVALKNELDLLIKELGLMANVSSISNELKAPMPGLIVDVLTKVGAEVKAGDGLIVLEAMKMENKLTAAQDGVIKSVNVKSSDPVEKGTVLIEFENNEENK